MRAIFMMPFAGWMMWATAVDAAPDVVPRTTPDAYAAAGEPVRLDDGRVVNLRCAGDGGPVVLLVAGGNADSSTWFRVQPSVARLAKVCAYDRAGYGFSSAAPLPRDLDAHVDEVHALIGAAHLERPLILVGHSMGSNIVRRFAQRFPAQVAGLVVVDPPEQGADAMMPTSWQQEVAPMLAQREALLATCEKAAAAADRETIRGKCLRQAPPWVSARVAAAIEAYKSDPGYWRTVRSEFEHTAAFLSAPVPLDEFYGGAPITLLRPASQDAGLPPEVRDILESARLQTHARILAGSPQRVLIEVSGTSHDIQLDRPDAVTAAIRRMLEGR